MDRMDRNTIHSTVDRVLDDAIALGLVLAPENFRKLFTFKVTPGRSASGGVKGTKAAPKLLRPFINLGVQSRHTSRERGMAVASEPLNARSENVWIQAHTLAAHGQWLFVEYSHIHDDDVIGGFVSNNAYHHGLAIICHEMSHAIQMWNHTATKEYIRLCHEGEEEPPRKVKKPVAHGKEFQDSYKALRTRYGLVCVPGTTLLMEKVA